MTAIERQWRCRMVGMEFGPMPMADLLDLARKGELSPLDDVCCTGEESWCPASSIAELAAAFPPQDQSTEPDRALLSPFSAAASVRTAVVLPTQPQSDVTAGTRELQIVQAIAKGGDGAAGASLVDEQRWFCRVGNVHYGPIRFRQLLRILGQEQFSLSPNDYVKHGRNGKWVQVHSIPDLMRAAGHEATEEDEESSTWEATTSGIGYRLRTVMQGMLTRLPSLPAVSLPTAIRLWLQAAFLGAWNWVWFLGPYLLIVVPWISMNVLLVGFPDTAGEVPNSVLGFIAWPVTWFSFSSLASTAAGFRLVSDRWAMSDRETGG